jgi:hypothetical protein
MGLTDVIGKKKRKTVIRRTKRMLNVRRRLEASIDIGCRTEYLFEALAPKLNSALASSPALLRPSSLVACSPLQGTQPVENKATKGKSRSKQPRLLGASFPVSLRTGACAVRTMEHGAARVGSLMPTQAFRRHRWCIVPTVCRSRSFHSYTIPKSHFTSLNISKTK